MVALAYVRREVPDDAELMHGPRPASQLNWPRLERARTQRITADLPPQGPQVES